MRLAGWTDRGAELLQLAAGKRFSWRHWNCCTFAARAVEAATGYDPREIFPRWHSKAEALAIIEACGGMEALARKALVERFGEPVSPLSVTRLSPVLCDFGNGIVPAVAWGVVCYAPGRIGLEHRPLSRAILGWSV